MWEVVNELLNQFITYLPQWTLIFIVLGIVGAIVFNKKWYMYPIYLMNAMLFKTAIQLELIKQPPITPVTIIMCLLNIVISISILIIFIKTESNNLVLIRRYPFVIARVILLLTFIIAMILIASWLFYLYFYF